MFYITFICILCDIATFLILNVIVVFLSCPATFTIKKHNDAITDSSLCVIEIESWGESGIHKDYIYDLFYTNGTKK